ncbi:MAG: outer membrane beta-barrel protein, partial [Crocinitomicaceae bacterium]
MRSLTLILLFSCLPIFGQSPNGRSEVKGEIFGNIIDSVSNQAVGYATVVALSQPEGKVAGGAVTQEDGSFSLSNLPLGKYTLKISFVGYNQKFIDGIELTESNTTHLLKDHPLAPSMLQTVEVYGDTPIITYEIDKKVVNVEDQQNVDGQTALEVLANVPSVTVSADGTVSLRGSSSFTLLINGIPTVMDPNDALAMIPASTIKDIEIITNPSAKFDAEGNVGVINIITKKSVLEGISSLMNFTAARFNNHTADASLNVKKEKIAFDLSGNFGIRSRPQDEINERITTYDSLVNRLYSEGLSDHKRTSWNGTVGFQWNPNNSHNLVLNSSYGSTVMRFINDKVFESYDNDSLVSKFRTDAHDFIPIRNISNSLFYQYNIKRNKNHYVSFKAIANLKYVTQNDSTLSYDEADQLIYGNVYTEIGPSNMYRFNADYRLPVKEDFKYEGGLQAQFGQSYDISRNYQYVDSTQTYDLNALYSSDVDYVRDVFAAYSMFGGTKGNFGFQGGLRAEYTYRLINSTAFTNFTQIKRLDWFPSAHFSYGFKNKSQILWSYSRRIERPRSWFFEPFITWNSPYEVRSGNPNLLPTYINNFEVSFMQPLKKKGFVSIDAYYRLNTNVEEWISSVYTEGILLRSPYNIGTSQSTGIGSTIDYRANDWYKLNFGFNTYYYSLDGS